MIIARMLSLYCVVVILCLKLKKTNSLQFGYTSRNIKIEPGATLIGPVVNKLFQSSVVSHRGSLSGTTQKTQKVMAKFWWQGSASI